MSIDGFTTPWWLLLLLVVAGLAGGYVWRQRRSRTHVLRFANLALLEKVMPTRPGWTRHVPAVLIGVSMLGMVIGLGGPTAMVQIPRQRAVVLLVIDVSLSMHAGDVVPSRLAAAQDAATAFVKQLPPGINLGLETFAGTAAILVSPLVDRTPVITEIQHLKLSESTATGDAINAAVSAIQTFEQSIPGGTVAAPPAKIVLMSDGKQTVGGDEFAAAQRAGAAKIPISTISFGTPDGLIMLDGLQVPVPVDDASLSQVARLSGGTFFAARSNAEIHQVYDSLGSQLGYETRRVDAAKPWFVLATLASLIAAAVTIGLGQRLPA